MRVKILIFLLVLIPGLLFALISSQRVITIFLIGDSTMADKPYQNGNPEKGWGQVFPLYFQEDVKIENHAVNGRSTKSFIDEGRWQTVMDKLQAGDYVIIQFGHNDAKQEDPSRYAEAQTDYRKNLEKFIAEARSKGAIPVVATPIVRRKFEEGKLIETHGEYPTVVREVAQQHQVPLIDLQQRTSELLQSFGEERSKLLFLHIQAFEYESLPEGKTDNTHLSAYGAFKVSDLVLAEMQIVLPQLAKKSKK